MPPCASEASGHAAKFKGFERTKGTRLPLRFRHGWRTQMLRGKKIAVLGVGKIGEALIRGLPSRGDVDAGQVRGTAGRAESHERLKSLGLEPVATNAEAVRGADVIIIAVKPSVVPSVLANVKSD